MLYETLVRIHVFDYLSSDSDCLLGKSCSLGLRYVFLVVVTNCQLSFFPNSVLEWEFLSGRAIS